VLPLSVNLRKVVDCILVAVPEKTGILLTVDELIKSAGEKREYESNIDSILSEIGYCLNSLSSTKFNTTVCTLDVKPFTRMQTLSGRPIDWIILSPLSYPTAVSLFPEKTPALLQCISDCNGHPRSLQYLAKTLLQNNKWNQLSYHQLSSLFLQVLLTAPIPRPQNINIIKAALLGDSVSLEDSPDGKNTYRELIWMGYLLNDLKGETTIIPRLSPLLLRAWAQNNESKTGTEDASMSQLINQLLSLEPNFDWKVMKKIFKFLVQQLIIISNMNFFMPTGSS
jgi:hypothetical protein